MQQIRRYFKDVIENEKPHFSELVNKFFGLQSKLFCLFYSRQIVSNHREFAKFLGTYYMSQAMGSHQTLEEVEDLGWWISPTNKNMMMSKADYLAFWRKINSTGLPPDGYGSPGHIRRKHGRATIC